MLEYETWMLLFILYQMDDCIILKFSYKYLLLFKRAAYRYMQAVVDEIIFGNVDPLKVGWFTFKMSYTASHQFLLNFLN